MNFDINEAMAQMMQAMKGSLAEDWDLAKKDASNMLQARKAKLDMLSQFFLEGDISLEKMQLRLQDEALVMEAELHAVAIVTKASAQRAANAAINVLEQLLLKAVNAVL